MYEYIRGKLIEKTPLYVVIEANGIGYKLYVPTNLLGKLPEIGEVSFLYLSWVVREMSQTLYAFATKEERELFERVTTISGIGPKTALAMVGHFEYSQLEEIVRCNDCAALSRVPGIGKKTAERLMLELRERLKLFPSSTLSSSSKVQDALNALLKLGYSQGHAEKAVKKAIEKLPEESDLSALVTLSLKIL